MVKVTDKDNNNNERENDMNAEFQTLTVTKIKDVVKRPLVAYAECNTDTETIDLVIFNRAFGAQSAISDAKVGSRIEVGGYFDPEPPSKPWHYRKFIVSTAYVAESGLAYDDEGLKF